MNLNRRKNIYTLGDFNQNQNNFRIKNRRQNSDPFERDPFKIQSYNFRYADRPTYPVPVSVNRPTPTTTGKRFETFYYNNDFAPNRVDKENSIANGKFHEFRRRKFLHDHQKATYNMPANQTTSSRFASGRFSSNVNQQYSQNSGSIAKQNTSPIFRSNTNRDYVQGIRQFQTGGANGATSPYQTNGYSCSHNTVGRQNTSRTSLSENMSAPERRFFENGYAGSSTTALQAKLSNPRVSVSQHNRQSFQTIQISSKNLEKNLNHLHRTSSSCSGCHININIKNLDNDETGGENKLTIKIEADEPRKSKSTTDDISIKRNLMSQTKLNRMSSPGRMDNFNIAPAPSSSSSTFVIDKHISKYAGKDRDREREREKLRELEQNRQKEYATIKEREREQLERAQREQERLHERARELERIRLREKARAERLYDMNRLYKSESYAEMKKTKSNGSTERLPRLVPWKELDENLRTCFPDGAERPPYLSVGFLGTSNGLRRIRNNYAATVKDYNNLRKQSEAQPQPLRVEKKLLNTLPEQQQQSRLESNKPIRNSETNLRTKRRLTSSSHTSLHKNTSDNSKMLRENSLPRRSSDINIRHAAATTALAKPNAHRNTPLDCRTPVNVNINVYTDKLKLLRV